MPGKARRLRRQRDGQYQLTDGRQTDDLVLMNSGQFREHVEVEIVELLVVVSIIANPPAEGSATAAPTVTA